LEKILDDKSFLTNNDFYNFDECLFMDIVKSFQIDVL